MKSQLSYDLTVSIITGVVVSLVNLLVLKKLVQKKYTRRLFFWLVVSAILVAALVWVTDPDKLRTLISRSAARKLTG